MSRNFGLGSRVMKDAGNIGLRAAAGRKEMSFSTAATLGDRWGKFCEWAADHGVKKMEHVTHDLVKKYGSELADQVSRGNMSPATGQNYVSAINSVMRLGTRWDSVRPTHDCGISARSNVRSEAPGAIDRDRYAASLDQVRQELGERAGSVVELARELGLRSKEASLLDARSALVEAHKTGVVTISAGTKGGLERSFEVSERQIQVLERAAAAQGDARAVMNPGSDWKTWRDEQLRDARELVQQGTRGGLHDLRAAYACERYSALTGHDAPCAGGEITDRSSDHEARSIISGELGHDRTDVVSAYVGGRR